MYIFICRTKRYAADSEEQTVLESMREYLLNTIQKTFEVGIDQAECLYQELLQCVRNKNLVSLQCVCVGDDDDESQNEFTIWMIDVGSVFVFVCLAAIWGAFPFHTAHHTHTHGRNVFLIPFRLQSPPPKQFLSLCLFVTKSR